MGSWERSGWWEHLTQVPPIIYYPLDDFPHSFSNNEMIAIDEGYNCVRFLFYSPDKFGIDDESVSIQSGYLYHPIAFLNDQVQVVAA
jgi:hypothetical protein